MFGTLVWSERWTMCDRFLDGDRSRMVLVPGNHDICWNTSRLACPGCVGPFWLWVVWRTCLKDSR